VTDTRELRYIEYYQPTFEWLTRIHQNAIRRALHEQPIEIRRKFFAAFSVGKEFAGEDGHAELTRYLNVLESAIHEALQRHSVPFWIHIYRRIGPFLSPLHDNRTDATTLGLVRDIVECSIAKYGRLNRVNDIRRSKPVPADAILGGHFLRRLRRLLPARAARERAVDELRTRDELVLCDFRPKDLVAIYAVEGLAYEYWLTTAKLRSIGKGDRQILAANGQLDRKSNRDLVDLMASYDMRAARQGTLSMLAGTFVQTKDARAGGLGKIFAPVYNVTQDKLDGLLGAIGFSTEHDPRPLANFVPHVVHIESFLKSHQFLASSFEATRGYSLRIFLLVLAALSWRAVMPERRVVQSIGASDGEMSLGLIHVLRRAYAIVDPEIASILSSVRWYTLHLVAPESDPETLDEQGLGRVLEDLILNVEKQSRIALWSRGPRYAVVLADEMAMIDIQGLVQMLESLFVGIRHSPQQRGNSFEDAVRSELEHTGYQMLQRHFTFDEGDREADAVVRVKDTLWIIEAHSMERPLTFEISKPGVTEQRNRRFAEKLDQAASIRKAIERVPIGANYDFRWATRVEHCVVSPFVEWIPSKDSQLWLTKDLPRILYVGELLEVLSR
jgi:Holliday junction resolvase-like predicted endonuclease